MLDESSCINVVYRVSLSAYTLTACGAMAYFQRGQM
jgi:hypothetical protein